MMIKTLFRIKPEQSVALPNVGEEETSWNENFQRWMQRIKSQIKCLKQWQSAVIYGWINGSRMTGFEWYENANKDIDSKA